MSNYETDDMYANIHKMLSFFLLCRCKENILVYACDCSTEALERTTEVIYASNVVSPKSRFRPFCWDFSTSRPPTWLLCDSCYETPLQKPDILHSGGLHLTLRLYAHFTIYEPLKFRLNLSFRTWQSWKTFYWYKFIKGKRVLHWWHEFCYIGISHHQKICFSFINLSFVLLTLCYMADFYAVGCTPW